MRYERSLMIGGIVLAGIIALFAITIPGVGVGVFLWQEHKMEESLGRGENIDMEEPTRKEWVWDGSTDDATLKRVYGEKWQEAKEYIRKHKSDVEEARTDRNIR
jgi:hypothetical protein